MPKQTLENTFKRYYDPADGRGAPISTMARIQGNTYDGLKAIYDRFGDDIELNIIDKPNGNENSIKYAGWQHLDVLKSQGTEQEINERLKTHLLNHYTRGEIDYECFKQSAGSDERAKQLISSLDRSHHRGTQENGNRREISSAGSSQSNQPQHSSRNQSVGRETQSLTSSTRITKTYLYTTPEDINQLQELKAQGVVAFDITHKVWYAKEADNPAVKQWLNRPNIPTPQESFADYLKANGIAVVGEHPILDGRAHRISNKDSADKKHALLSVFLLEQVGLVADTCHLFGNTDDLCAITHFIVIPHIQSGTIISSDGGFGIKNGHFLRTHKISRYRFWRV